MRDVRITNVLMEGQLGELRAPHLIAYIMLRPATEDELLVQRKQVILAQLLLQPEERKAAKNSEFVRK